MLSPSFRYYSIYGVVLASEILLPYPETASSSPPAVRVLVVSRRRLQFLIRQLSDQQVAEGWLRRTVFADGSLHMCKEGLVDFLVSPNGDEIVCSADGRASNESVHTYLLGHALSFALLKKGMEHLHATVVVIDGQAIGLLGDCGYGKSTLAAAFLELGHRLLTDDMLVIGEEGGRLIAHPGPSRIKLFNEVATRYLNGAARGTPVAGLTSKLVFPLPEGSVCQVPVPLRVLYCLPAPERLARTRSIRIRRLSPREALISLLRHTFNVSNTEPERLKRQFAAAAQLVPRLPIKRLSYPRELGMLPAVREAILKDLAIHSR